MEMVAEIMGKVLAGEVDLAFLERNAWSESLKAGREALKELLQALDDALLESRPEGLKVLGKKPRRMLTLMGEITFSRRHYRDREGGHRFLLDELLGLEARSRLSPEMKEAAARTSAQLPYRAACEVIGFFLPDAPSHTTLMHQVRGLGEGYSREQREGAETLFSTGELPPSEGREAEILYSELDGTIINLQREEKRKGELKLAITHEGWGERGDGEYVLRSKRVHMGIAPARDFARTHIYDLATRWRLGGVSRFVISGDGAPLAEEAADLAPRSLFQLDRFHLRRAVTRALAPDGEAAARVYELATAGRVEQAAGIIKGISGRSRPGKRREAERLISYLEANREGLIDYRERLQGLGDDARGLGAVEGNIDKSVANRFKKRGMRFTVKGADSLAKVIELKQNGKLASRLEERRHKAEAEERRHEVIRTVSLVRERLKDDPEGWLSVHMPALYGPDPDAHWVKVLRGISHVLKAV